MSFQLNSDREQIKGLNPTTIGESAIIFRSGSGADEKEVFRAALDPNSKLPRLGINRTGSRVDSVTLITPGSGYFDTPTVEFSPPNSSNGIRTTGSAVINTIGNVTAVSVDNPGDGYDVAPTVTISGGGGFGATATAALDSIDFELDVNGAIRTSTSIISDTANIINLEVQTLATANIKHRAPHLKTFANGTGVAWAPNNSIQKDDYVIYPSTGNGNVYQASNTGVTGTVGPTHLDGTVLNGTANLKHVGFRTNDPNAPFYTESGDSGIFPRSVTPLLGDRSDKIATTEYVLNLATNDVGGRIYVSEQIGDDNNDGRSAVAPVRTIKKAAQLAWATPGVKESIIISGGNYVEDNPISLPPDCSVVGDNLRLVIIRPFNLNKHIFKFGDKNYVIGVTYQDKVNPQGGSIGTWDFAMVFDDKQRITYDSSVTGDFGTSFPIGHQFFGPQTFQQRFFANGGGAALVSGTPIAGISSNVDGRIGSVTFDITDPTDQNVYQTGLMEGLTQRGGNNFTTSEAFWYGGQGTVKWEALTNYSDGDVVWAFDNVYEVAVNGAGTSGETLPVHVFGDALNGTVNFTYLRQAYQFTGQNLGSTRAEGEVVFEDTDTSSELPIVRVDFSLQGTFDDGYQSSQFGSNEDLGGVVLYTNQLIGANNVHDFKEGEEIEIRGFPTSSPDLSWLNGRQRIYKVIEDADGASRRIVLPKKVPVSLGFGTTDNWVPGDFGYACLVKSASKSVTFSLLNSPNKFLQSEPSARRYQDACLLIRNNIDFIADEVVGKINDEFKKEYFSIYDLDAVGTNDFKVYLGTSRFVHTYISGGTVEFAGQTYNIVDFVYDNVATGEATISIDTAFSNTVLSEDITVKLADILVQCTIDGVVTQKTYPSFNIPVSDNKCRRDIGHYINAVIRDLEFGSNYNVIESAKKYIGGTGAEIDFVNNEIIQTVRAIEYTRELIIYAARKWRTGNGTPVDPEYVAQYSTIPRYVDETVIDDTASPACSNVVAAIDTLTYLYVDVLANDASGTYLDAAYLIARNRDYIADEAYLTTKQRYPSLGLNDVDERKCRRDINFILSGVLRDLVLSGNYGSVEAAESYYTGTALTGVPSSELGATRNTFLTVRDLSIQAMRNWKTATGSSVNSEYTIIPQFTDNTILVDADGTPTAQLTPTDATYDPATGDFVMTFGAPHGATTSESIRLDVESFVFTCSMDGNKTEHYLPDLDQPAATQLIPIDSVTTNTITINVGASDPDQTFTPTDATYDPATGDFVITIGSHDLSPGEGIILLDNSFSFTCEMDDDDSVKTYPRPDIDPFASKSLKIKSTTTNTITVNVGASGPNKYFTPSNAVYNAATGDMTVTVGQHGLGVGRSVVLEDNSFTFTCDQDGNVEQKTYPRPGSDPYAGKSIAITAVGNTTHTPTDADYQVFDGRIVFTLANHGFTTGDYIKIDDNAITLTCSLDGDNSQETYPRSFDYGSGRWFEITVINTDAFAIEGLPIPRDLSTHQFVSFATGGLQRQDGTFTINVGNAGTASGSVHTFVSATTDAIKHEPQSIHTFVSATANAVQHLPQSTHTFRRTVVTDPVAVYPAGGNAPCADVEASLTTSFALIDGILEFASDSDSATAITPGSTNRTTGTLFDTSAIINYPDNIIQDSAGNTITIRSRWDDFPIISASPYTQNSSIISKEGGGGALIDGSKVKSPNCPFPGLNQEGKAINPNQGKSMVAAAFTIVSEKNGVGYKIIEDGYVQLVSVFCIFCVDGVLAESGGYASVTNSASNFGTYALRARGYREEAYEFDAGFTDTQGVYQRAEIDVVAQAVNGNTEFTVDKIGRVPLEHYIVKIDGLTTSEDIEYYVDEIPPEGVLTEASPYRVQLVITNGAGGKPAEFYDETTGLEVSVSSLVGRNIAFHRPSIVNSSSHTWEFVGAGVDYNALPENGGQKRDANEQVSEAYGRVYASGTDELGDFKVGDFAKIENRTGNIQFTGTVSISEVNFLKLSSGSVVIRGFDKSPTLGGAGAADDILPTQKAVRDYITNNLGQYINKNYSTNPVPRALVELTDSGLISEDQLPAVSPFSVYTVDTQAERLALEGVRAGDIAIEDGTAYILNTDTYSLFLGINVDTSLQFTSNDVFTGSVTGGKISLSEYRPGVVYRIIVDEGGQGSGYTSAPNVVLTDDGNTQAGHVPAAATATVVNGEIVSINIVQSDNYVGGQGYTTAPTVTFTGGGGSGASATAFIESRLYGPIVNSIKMTANDTIESSNVPSDTVDIVRVVNTSGELDSNWVSLSTTTVSASDITGGPIPTGLLASNSAAANSNTFLAGDQSYKPIVQSVRGVETRFFIPTALSSGADTLTFDVTDDIIIGYSVNNSVTGIQAGTTVTQVTTVEVGTETYTRITLSDGLTSSIAAGTFIEFLSPASPLQFNTNLTEAYFVESILVIDGGSGFAQDEGGTFTYNDVPILSGNGTGLVAKFIVENGEVVSVSVVNGGTGYTNGDFDIDDIPTEIGTEGSGLILEAKVNTSNKNYGNVTIDIARAGGESSTSSDADYGSVGVARFKKSQFIIGEDGDGSVTLKTGQDSGLNADLLDGLDSGYFLNVSNMEAGTLAPEFLSGTYNITITQGSGFSLSLSAKDGATTTDSDPDEIIDGLSVDVRQNSTNGLLDPNTNYADGNNASGTSYNTVVSIFGGSSGAYGGVGQLAFTNANNFWVRGSSGSVAESQTFSTWSKVWTSGNDFSRFQGEEPADTRKVAGPDAYRLKGRVGSWWQNSNNQLYGTISDDRLPKTQRAKDFDTSVRVTYGTSGIPIDVYLTNLSSDVVNKITTSSPFSTDSTLNFLTSGGNINGSITKQSITVYNNDGTVANTASSTLDYTNLYAIIRGILTSGTDPTAWENASTIGSTGAGNSVAFTKVNISSYPLTSSGTSLGNIEICKLSSDGGTARLTLGRADGSSNSNTSPAIYFRSSATVPDSVNDFYNARIVASGGNDTSGSGVLNVEVADSNSFTIEGNIIWNAGNSLITALNTGSTYTTTGGNSDFEEANPDENVSIRSIVMRDENGNFATNTITATLNGVATGNLSSGGGTLSGGLTIGNSNQDQDLTVYGPTTLNGSLYVEGDTEIGDQVLYVNTTAKTVGIGREPLTGADPFSIYYRNAQSGTSGNTLLKLTNDVRDNQNPPVGTIQRQSANLEFSVIDSDAVERTQAQIGLVAGEPGVQNPSSTQKLSGNFVIYTATGTGTSTNSLTEKVRVTHEGRLAVGTTEPTHKLHVVGDVKITTNLDVVESINLGNTANNDNAPLYFNGGTVGLVDPAETDPVLKEYFNNFRLGNNILQDDVFEITSTDGPAIESGDPVNTYKSTPAIAVQGTNNRVAINTLAFGGTDNSGTDPIERDYTLNVNGDVNFNGILYQNNEEFVTSRWTEPVKNGPIYRLTKVGVNTTIDVNTPYAFSVGFTDEVTPTNSTNGDINMTGQLFVNDQAQWVDKYGVIKVALNTIDEDTTIPDNTNANSIGEIFINSNAVVEIGDNSAWTII